MCPAAAPATSPVPVFVMRNSAGHEPERWLPLPVPPLPILNNVVPPATNSSFALKVGVGVGPGDADAGGTPTAATITGTVHATPLTTLRRLKPFSSPLVTFSFNTSDNDAPVVVFSRGGSFKDRQRGSAGPLPGFDYSPERDLRFLQSSCKVGSRSAVWVSRDSTTYSAENVVPPSSVTIWSDSRRPADAEQSSHRPTNWWGQVARLKSSPVDNLMRMGSRRFWVLPVRRETHCFSRRDDGAGE